DSPQRRGIHVRPARRGLQPRTRNLKGLRMKPIKGQTRQGDVLMLPTKKAVGKRKRQPTDGGRVVLAHGERTGHAHALAGNTASLYLDDATTVAPDVMPMLALAGGLPGDRLLRA